MTVQSTTPWVQYTYQAGVTDYPVTFTFDEEADLAVIDADADGVETTLVLTTDYTVAGGEGSTGTVTYSGLASGHTLTIYRDTEITQVLDLVNNSDYDAEVLETTLDKLTRVLQELDKKLARSLLYPASYTGDVEDATAYVDQITIIKAAAEVAQAAAEAAQDLAEQWASKTNGAVDGDYSAKAHAVGGTGVTDVTGAAKEWATKTVGSGKVDGVDYSSKAYAQGQLTGAVGGSAKDWAQTTGGTVDGSERSAKAYAQEDLTGAVGGSAKDWAQTDEDTPVDGSEYSAKHYAAKTADLFNSIATGGDFFEYDASGDLQPTNSCTTSTSWDLDGNGDIMPAT